MKNVYEKCIFQLHDYLTYIIQPRLGCSELYCIKLQIWGFWEPKDKKGELRKFIFPSK